MDIAEKHVVCARVLGKYNCKLKSIQICKNDFHYHDNDKCDLFEYIQYFNCTAVIMINSLNICESNIGTFVFDSMRVDVLAFNQSLFSFTLQIDFCVLF